MCTSKKMHWTVNLDAPAGKIYYTDKSGDTSEVVGGLCWHEFRGSMEQDRIEELWPALGRHRGGLGLARRADFQAGSKHYRWLVKTDRMREAEALMSTLTGTLWLPQRLVETGIAQPDAPEARCPFCGHEGVDEGHLFSECNHVQACAHPAVQKTNRYSSEYHRNGLCMICYWWRGLQPKEQTTPVHYIRASCHMVGTPVEQDDSETVTVYTDG